MVITCCRCKQAKDETQFCSNKSRHNGKDTMCMICRREYNNNHAAENREKRREKNRIYYSENKRTLKIKHKEYILKNKIAISEKQKAYRKRNVQQYNKLSREWQLRNPERAKEIHEKTIKKNWQRILEQQRNKRKTDPKYRIMNRMRSGFKGWLSGAGKTCSVIDLIGISKEDFIKYIESQFNDFMTWENIHIDHYIPLSFFSPFSEEDMRIAWNYRNMRPLLAEDNIKKGNRLPVNYKEHIEMIKNNLTTAST